jgi:hypothetical protein
MANPPTYRRSVEKPYRRLVLASGRVVMGLGVAAAIGVGAAAMARQEPATVTVAASPVVVTPPAAPPPQVVVQPAPVVIQPPPAPEPPPAPVIRPRAPTPLLIPECLYEFDWLGDRPQCNWDNGFPAISGDGKTIAFLSSWSGPSDEQLGAAVAFLDVRTAKRVRTLTLYRHSGMTDMTDAETYQLYRKLPRRVDEVQKVLDRAGYRSMQDLGTGYAESPEPEPTEAPTRVYAEFNGENVRAIDPATHEVLWQGRFAAPRPVRDLDDDDDCDGFSLASTSAWWDPETRVAYVQQGYNFGGCMCGSGSYELVRRMP